MEGRTQPGPGTPGGRRLRALRRAAGRTQLWVEAEAELGTGYLQRVESGKVVQPERGTLERILNALDAGYSERREALELFGYVVNTPPPSASDHAWARATARYDLDEAPFPAYVLDCAHQLVAWNRLVPRLFGVVPDDPLLGRLAVGSLVSKWFDPASPLPRLIVEPDRFLPALIRALRYEMRQFGHEPWHVRLMEQFMALERFRHYWEIVEREPVPAGAARALVPVRLKVAGASVLQFRLSSEAFARDARFRTIYYFPADLPTMQWCATLASAVDQNR